MNDSPEINILKKQIRGLIKQRKLQQSESQRLDASSAIFRKIENLAIFQKATVIFAYWSMNDEVHTHDFIEKWYRRKTILLPCTVGDEMILKPYSGKEKMILNERFGIYEPDSTVFTEIAKIDFVIVPGVAFDKMNNRLGRGKAFYDKFLIKTDACKIGVCFDFQFLDQIPADEHDVKMDMIIRSY